MAALTEHLRAEVGVGNIYLATDAPNKGRSVTTSASGDSIAPPPASRYPSVLPATFLAEDSFLRHGCGERGRGVATHRDVDVRDLHPDSQHLPPAAHRCPKPAQGARQGQRQRAELLPEPA